MRKMPKHFSGWGCQRGCRGSAAAPSARAAHRATTSHQSPTHDGAFAGKPGRCPASRSWAHDGPVAGKPERSAGAGFSWARRSPVAINPTRRHVAASCWTPRGFVAGKRLGCRISAGRGGPKSRERSFTWTRVPFP